MVIMPPITAVIGKAISSHTQGSAYQRLVSAMVIVAILVYMHTVVSARPQKTGMLGHGQIRIIGCNQFKDHLGAAFLQH